MWGGGGGGCRSRRRPAGPRGGAEASLSPSLSEGLESAAPAAPVSSRRRRDAPLGGRGVASPVGPGAAGPPVLPPPPVPPRASGPAARLGWRGWPVSLRGVAEGGRSRPCRGWPPSRPSAAAAGGRAVVTDRRGARGAGAGCCVAHADSSEAGPARWRDVTATGRGGHGRGGT